MIAVGILGLNYHMFKGEIFSKAYAASNEVHKIAICEERGIHCASVTDSGWLRVLNYK